MAGKTTFLNNVEKYSDGRSIVFQQPWISRSTVGYKAACNYYENHREYVKKQVDMLDSIEENLTVYADCSALHREIMISVLEGRSQEHAIFHCSKAVKEDLRDYPNVVHFQINSVDQDMLKRRVIERYGVFNEHAYDVATKVKNLLETLPNYNQ